MTNDTALRRYGLAAFAGFIACVFGANWALDHYGIRPVGFGLYAPAGVFFAGLTFGLRDAVHDTLGRAWAVAAIVTGAALSAVLDVDLALASGVAFLVSELADMAVYEPLRERWWPAAVALSNTVGAVVDSLLFLSLAGLPLALWRGQVLGKAYMIVAAFPLVWVARRDRDRRAAHA